MENKVILNPKDIFSSAFNLAKKNLLSFFVIIMCFVVIEMINPNKGGGMFAALRSLIGMALSIYVSISTIGAVMKLTEGKELGVKDFLTWPTNGLKMLLASIVTGVITAAVVGIGFLLMLVLSFIGAVVANPIFAIIFVCVFGGLLVYVSIRLSFAKYHALAAGTGVIDSIKKSLSLTKNNVMNLIWMSIIMLGIIILGIVALVVGLIWAIPTVIIAQVLIYKIFTGSGKAPETVNNIPEIQPLELQANTVEAEPVSTLQN